MKYVNCVSTSEILLSQGFRLFFLLAGIFAVVSMLVWGVVLSGHGPALSPLWHGHEMIFGYGGAVIAGFVLTATTNWTGRPTITGKPLAALGLLWVLARIAVTAPGLPNWLVAALTSSFFIILAIGTGRHIVATESRRNYGVILVLLSLSTLELYYWLSPSARGRILSSSLLFVLLLIAFIGGRIIPMFTRNATPGLEIRPMWKKRDYWALSTLAALSGMVLVPGTPNDILASVAMLGAGLHAYRMLGWGGSATFSRPILSILHGSYACIPIGLLLLAINWLGGPVPQLVAMHVLAIGAFGMMTVGMMTRVSLGHTGRAIKSDLGTSIIYSLIGFALIARTIGLYLSSRSYIVFLFLAITFWCAAFLIFIWKYSPKLLCPRVDNT